MRPNPKRMADVIRMPGVQGGAAAAGAAAVRPEIEGTPPDPEALGAPPEVIPPPAALDREKLGARIAAWQAPILSDEIVDTLATIFLMQPGHELMPFFLWLEGKLK